MICQYAFAPRDGNRSITWHLFCHLPHLAKPLHPSPGPESRVNTAGYQAAPGVPARGRENLPAPGPSHGLGLASSVGFRLGLEGWRAAFREQMTQLPTSPKRTYGAEGRGKKKSPRHGEPAAGVRRARTFPGAHPWTCRRKRGGGWGRGGGIKIIIS